jgi:hypothetical protein
MSTAVASKTGGVDADRVQQQPAARDLRDDGDEHEPQRAGT